MCGIFGIISCVEDKVRQEDLKTMSLTMEHRGPDGAGYWINSEKSVGLGHNRLAILDVSENGAQPMLSADQRYVIVYNGEIYNFIELKRELVSDGCIFRTDTDTEVLLEAWRMWGVDMLPRLNGMWAFAIYDKKSNEVFFARDRFGVKPLLYSSDSNVFTFASEVRGLLALSWLDRTIDRNVIERMLFDPFSIEGSEYTLHKHIKRLPAGHFCIWKNGTFSVQRWWNTLDHLVEVPTDKDVQIKKFKELFFDSVALRMRSDVPIGTCLSGGFDSSAILCVMSAIAEQKALKPRSSTDWRKAFIASFPRLSNDETYLAVEIAKFANVKENIIEFSELPPIETIDDVMSDLDDVYIGLTTAPWMIYKALRKEGIVVSLDGHGADELMGGYRQKGNSFAFLIKNIIDGGSTSYFQKRIIEFAKLIRLKAKGFYFLRSRPLNPPEPLRTPFDNDKLPVSWGALNRRLYKMFHVTVLPTILRNFDRISMAHGVEVRMPFLDWRLVTYVMSLPDDAKSDGVYSKLIARQALSGILPDNVRLERRKVGFNSPMPEWLNGQLMQVWLSKLFEKDNAVFDDIVDTKALVLKINELNTNQAWDWEAAARLWPYINLKWRLDKLI